MLFDLRSPRRRAAIKVIYSTLAILMGGGLIFFGIGSDATGGLADLFGGGDSPGSAFDDQIEDAENQVEENPRDQAALLDVVTLNLQAGSQSAEGVDEQTGYPIIGSESKDHYSAAAQAWAQYLKLKPRKPDAGAALLLADSYFVLAVNGDSAADADQQIDNAADAQKVAAEQNPILGNLTRLANYLYLAGRFAEGDRVAAQAVAKAPPGQREQVRKQLEAVKKQGMTFQKQVKAEAKGAGAGGNPLEQPGAGGLGGSSLGGSSISGP